MEHREAFERRLLVRCVVVDVRIGIRREASGDEVHQLLERTLLFGAAVCPERGELRLATVDMVEPEQIVEWPIVEERIAFDVEEEISRVRLRKPRESLGILEGE